MDELKKYFETEKDVKSDRCKEIVLVLKRIEKSWSTNIDQIKISNDFSFLRDTLKNRNYKTFQKFKNDIGNNRQLIYKMLNIETIGSRNNDDDETLKKGFAAVQKIKNGYKPDDFVFNATNEEIAKIDYSYLYAKSIRNRINHASSEDNLTRMEVHLSLKVVLWILLSEES